MSAPRWLRTAGLVLAAFAGGAVTSQAVHARNQSSSPYDPFDQLSWVLVLVENHYVDPAQRNKIVEGAIKGMVAELDPHSAYMTPQEYTLFQSDTEGKFGGIGVEVDFRDERVIVLAPMEGSPAARGGVKAGDEIVAIEGKLVRGERLEKIIGLMRGPAGSRVRITLRRQGVSEAIQLDLAREEIHVASVVGKRLDSDIAYVKLRQFQAGTHEELLRVTAKLRAESSRPLRGVLLDMRNNPGGLVDEAEAVADEMLDTGVIYTTRHRGKVIDEAKASGGGALANLPIVTLVNEYSASSSELVAGALQDNRRASVIGSSTFGKGSVQTIFDLPGGAGMRLTTMRYYTPSGRSIQAQGIQPDVRVEASRPLQPGEVVRESDLDGHLPAEAGGGTANTNVARGPIVRATADDTGPARDVPTDPTKGSDFVLATGYKMLIERLGAAPR
ncbi:S41 family peptidase [Polyangium jinanense]|uniref:S41 family peptidase n=1 Tax=Polyangium jinanense TaxID=2829994 RepID=A0A9X4AS78_9BACT|nr:S41 family peptidase [Polyangium jinanense]MDC3954552.1 S41 family peptidase [Polyangium jinanense]MDC3980855.1 S41 family peptidase [Polyangium jinanense]